MLFNLARSILVHCVNYIIPEIQDLDNEREKGVVKAKLEFSVKWGMQNQKNLPWGVGVIFLEPHSKAHYLGD